MPASAKAKQLFPLGKFVALFLLSLFLCQPVAGSEAQSGAPVQSVDQNHKSVQLDKLDRFEDAVRALELKDRNSKAEDGATVFVGSSTIARWSTLEEDLHDVHALNRGFGGSTIDEVTNYSDRIISKYHPRRIVFYAGTNDIAELHHNADEVYKDFVEFVDHVRSKLPSSEIYFVSLSVAPSRLAEASEYLHGNQLISSYCKKKAHLHFIDITKVMREKDGSLKTELFGEDHLHMNSQGYAAWTPIIRRALKHSPE